MSANRAEELGNGSACHFVLVFTPPGKAAFVGTEFLLLFVGELFYRDSALKTIFLIFVDGVAGAVGFDRMQIQAQFGSNGSVSKALFLKIDYKAAFLFCHRDTSFLKADY